MEKMKVFIEEYWPKILIGLSILTLLLFGMVIFSFWEKEIETAPKEVYEQLIVDEVSEEPSSAIEEEVIEALNIDIMVDVKGAVIQPGVYKMQDGSRIIDAIQIAGGLLNTAEERGVNFAQIVEDQMVIYVPEIGEEIEDIAKGPLNPINDPQSEKIDINHADKSALMILHGIGDSKAESIIRHRDEYGTFKTIEDITDVSGIGEATFLNIKDSIKVSP